MTGDALRNVIKLENEIYEREVRIEQLDTFRFYLTDDDDSSSDDLTSSSDDDDLHYFHGPRTTLCTYQYQ